MNAKKRVFDYPRETLPPKSSQTPRPRHHWWLAAGIALAVALLAALGVARQAADPEPPPPGAGEWEWAEPLLATARRQAAVQGERAATLRAVLADPQAFTGGAKDIAPVVSDNAALPPGLAVGPGGAEDARTYWLLIGVGALVATALPPVLRWRPWRRPAPDKPGE
jgi:hypothetical protein